MNGGAGGGWSGRVVVVLGRSGPVLEAALRSLGFVRVCEGDGAEVWVPAGGAVGILSSHE